MSGGSAKRSDLGTSTVWINGRASVLPGSSSGPERGAVDGSRTVLIRGKPAVGVGHALTRDAELREGSSDTLIGGGALQRTDADTYVRYHLHVDADRDGRVDYRWEHNADWEAGRERRGAVVLVNCDDDARKARPGIGGDYDSKSDGRAAPVEDSRKPGRQLDARDLPDIAPLVVRRDPLTLGRSSEGWKVRLRVSRHTKVRVFDRRAPGGVEVLGPKAGKVYELPTLPLDEIELGMEATQYPGPYPWPGRDPDPVPDFDGKIVFTLEVIRPDGALDHTEEAVVRVAPWLAFNHFDPTDEVIVITSGTQNATFLREFRGAVAPSGAKLTVVTTGGGDVWAQDVMEPGFSTLARSESKGWSLPVILRAPRSRKTETERLPRQMQGPDWGYVQALPDGSAHGSLDSFGNLECTPPFRNPRTGAEYQFGRIVYGTSSGGPHPEMREEVIRFLQAQSVQDPIPLDSGWLLVGHVDEFLSFLPMKDAPFGFRVMLASPALALELIRSQISKGHGDATLRSGATSHEPIREWLELKHLEAITRFVEGKIAAAMEILRAEIGLGEDDFIRVPVVFDGTPKSEKKKKWEFWKDESAAPSEFQLCIARSPGLVNGLCITRGAPRLYAEREVHFIMPKTFGPMVNGRSVFEDYTDEVLGPTSVTGVSTAYVDNFTSYHLLQGQVHCGSNSIRRPPEDRFWWHQATS